MQGKIIKGIAGFYYVHVAETGIFECKAKGIFRKEKIKPLVGDNVELELLDMQDMTGNITSILPRKNELIRPAVANVDQAMVIFAADKPKPNLNLLDRFLIMMEQRKVETIICFNKQDLVAQDEIDRGKHTTRHSQLLYIDRGTYIMDTPGFSSLYLMGLEAGELKFHFREFESFEPLCRFQGCSHIHEPDCAVKTSLAEGKISPIRYENYVMLYEELKNVRKYDKGGGKR